MGGKKRKSDPGPTSTSSRIRLATAKYDTDDSNLSSSTDSRTGEDFEKLISAIHGKFKKKTKEQQVKAEDTLKTTINTTVDAIQRHIDSYEKQLSDKMEELKSGLERIQGEREAQVTMFRSKYKEIKETMHSVIKTVEGYDAEYRAMVDGFLTTAMMLEKNAKESTKDALATVPTILPSFTTNATNTRSKKSK